MTRTNDQPILEDIFIELPAGEVGPGVPHPAASGSSANSSCAAPSAASPASRLRVHLSTDGSADVRSPDDGGLLAGARSILSIPIRARAGAAGAVHLIGSHAGGITVEDGEHLRAFAEDVGAAYERFLRRERAGDTTGRGLRMLLGVGAMAVGLLLVLGAAWTLEARAMPLSRLPARPGVWSGAVLTTVGLLLARGRRRRIV